MNVVRSKVKENKKDEYMKKLDEFAKEKFSYG